MPNTINTTNIPQINAVNFDLYTKASIGDAIRLQLGLGEGANIRRFVIIRYLPANVLAKDPNADTTNEINKIAQQLKDRDPSAPNLRTKVGMATLAKALGIKVDGLVEKIEKKKAEKQLNKGQAAIYKLLLEATTDENGNSLWANKIAAYQACRNGSISTIARIDELTESFRIEKTAASTIVDNVSGLAFVTYGDTQALEKALLKLDPKYSEKAFAFDWHLKQAWQKAQAFLSKKETDKAKAANKSSVKKKR